MLYLLNINDVFLHNTQLRKKDQSRHYEDMKSESIGSRATFDRNRCGREVAIFTILLPPKGNEVT